MLNILKDQTSPLSPSAFAQVWAGVETIDAALANAGEHAVLVLRIVNERELQRRLDLIEANVKRIAFLEGLLGDRLPKGDQAETRA